MEQLNAFWEQIKPFMPTIIQVIVIPILLPVIKKIVTMVVGSKLDETMNEKKLEAMYKRVFEDVIAQIKEISFTQNIQPILNSTLVDIQEKAIAMIKEDLTQKKLTDKQGATMFKHFMDMFRQSVMNSPEIQAQLDIDYDELMKMLDDKSQDVIETTVVVEEPKKKKSKQTGIMEN